MECLVVSSIAVRIEGGRKGGKVRRRREHKTEKESQRTQFVRKTVS